ncbi:MAG: PTS sugar transporter subunit IIB [Chloroflexi bacterium]|nr:PTS sugar transporter subunit IIB [Chloroflexota bacterium]
MSPAGRVLVRVDDRLVHGQVIFDWLRYLDPVCVMVVHESLDDGQRALVRSALAERYQLWIGNARDAAEYLWQRSDENAVLVLLPSLEELQLLLSAGYNPEVVMLGALGWRTGRQRVSAQVYLSPSEKEVLRSLTACGLNIIIQARYHDLPLVWRPDSAG